MTFEQIRVYSCYEYNLNYSAAEATRNIMKALDADFVTKRTVQLWFVRLRAGNFNLKDKLRRWRPSSINNEALNEQTECDPLQIT